MSTSARTVSTSGRWTVPATRERALRRAARDALGTSESSFRLSRPVLEQQADERGRLLGTAQARSLSAENDLALSYLADARDRTALDHLDRLATDCAAALGPHHPDTLVVRGNLAVARLAAGHTGEARDDLAVVIADRSRVLGPDHLSTLNGRLALCLAHLCGGRTQAAAELLGSTLAAAISRFGTGHALARTCRALLDEVHG